MAVRLADLLAGQTRDAFYTALLPQLTRGRPPLERARLAFAALTRGGVWGNELVGELTRRAAN